MVTISITRTQPDFAFDAVDADGHKVSFDSSPDFGGTNYGVRPMQSLLMALGTCSGIDIVSILKKKKQSINSFTMDIHGEREKGKEPALWISAHIVYTLSGPDDIKKIEQAVKLSIDKYCSVAETLRRAGCKITWEAKLI